MKLFIWLIAAVGFVLCFWWVPEYTVYVTPLKIMQLDASMVVIYLYRFLIGSCLSIVIIYLVKRYESKLEWLAKYGQYSLIIYTVSLALLSVLKQVFDDCNLHTNLFGIIDILSLALCLMIVFLSIKFRDLCLKAKWSKAIFLGEK